jgi:hypothetical protein
MTIEPAVSVRWHTPPPTAVDERLVVGADRRARLTVCRPRSQRDRVGTYDGEASAEDLAALAEHGPTIDLDLVAPDPRVASAGVLADEVADGLRASPTAVASFRVHALSRSGGSVQLALLVTGDGSRPVEFVLSVTACAVHWGDGTRETGWAPLPSLPIGFMTPDAEGLGGVGDRAEVPPGVSGAIAFASAIPGGASQVWVQASGLLFLPEETVPAAFEILTAATALPAG